MYSNKTQHNRIQMCALSVLHYYMHIRCEPTHFGRYHFFVCDSKPVQELKHKFEGSTHQLDARHTIATYVLGLYGVTRDVYIFLLTIFLQ